MSTNDSHELGRILATIEQEIEVPKDLEDRLVEMITQEPISNLVKIDNSVLVRSESLTPPAPSSGMRLLDGTAADVEAGTGPSPSSIASSQ